MFVVTTPHASNEISVSFSKKGQLRAKIYWAESHSIHYFRFGKDGNWFSTNTSYGQNEQPILRDCAFGHILYQLTDKIEDTRLLQEAFKF